MKFKNCQFFKKGIFWLMSCRCEKNWICANRNSAISPVQTHIQHFKIQMNCSEFFSAFFTFQFDQKRVFYLSSLFLLLLVDAFLLFLCVIAKSVCIKSMSRFQWQKIATKEIFCFIQWIWWLEICTIILTFGYKLPKNTLADLKKRRIRQILLKTINVSERFVFTWLIS